MFKFEIGIGEELMKFVGVSGIMFLMFLINILMMFLGFLVNDEFFGV